MAAPVTQHVKSSHGPLLSLYLPNKPARQKVFDRGELRLKEVTGPARGQTVRGPVRPTLLLSTPSRRHVIPRGDSATYFTGRETEQALRHKQVPRGVTLLPARLPGPWEEPPELVLQEPGPRCMSRSCKCGAPRRPPAHVGSRCQAPSHACECS